MPGGKTGLESGDEEKARMDGDRRNILEMKALRVMVTIVTTRRQRVRAGFPRRQTIST